MRQWKLEFKGKLKHNETGKSEDFEISFDWKSDESCFMYDTQMSKIASAKAFAREPWNRQYFDDLKKQVHTWNRVRNFCLIAHFQSTSIALRTDGQSERINQIFE